MVLTHINKKEVKKQFWIGFFIGLSVCGVIAAILLAILMM